jgi:hypothetical protein
MFSESDEFSHKYARKRQHYLQFRLRRPLQTDCKHGEFSDTRFIVLPAKSRKPCIYYKRIVFSWDSNYLLKRVGNVGMYDQQECVSFSTLKEISIWVNRAQDRMNLNRYPSKPSGSNFCTLGWYWFYDRRHTQKWSRPSLDSLKLLLFKDSEQPLDWKSYEGKITQKVIAFL